MAHIPALVSDTHLDRYLNDARLKLVHKGKVRSTYALSDSKLLLVVATDRISIFDFVLSATVDYKGEVLTAMTVFWLTGVLKEIPNHLVAFGSDIDKYLPQAIRNNPALQARALVVKKLKMFPIECIVRGYLTGSGWESYQVNGEVCGIQLPAGLHDGSQILPTPLFTPTTKAEVGHDEPLNADSVVLKYGAVPRDRSLICYQKIADFARKRGIIIADTKFEFGTDDTLADEVGTPDSSRFWDKREWLASVQQQTSPSSRDKQQMRDWGKTVNITKKLDPESKADLATIDHIVVPDRILDMTSKTYGAILRDLTGMELGEFQKTKMKISG